MPQPAEKLAKYIRIMMIFGISNMRYGARHQLMALEQKEVAGSRISLLSGIPTTGISI